MKTLYILVPVFMLSIHTEAQLTVQNLVHFVDCRDFNCISESTQTKGYLFTDSTYDGEFKITQNNFEHKPPMALYASNKLSLEYDGFADKTVVVFETHTEDYYRKLVNDIVATGFVVNQTLTAGDVIYKYPTSRVVIFVITQPYEDGCIMSLLPIISLSKIPP